MSALSRLRKRIKKVHAPCGGCARAGYHACAHHECCVCHRPVTEGAAPTPVVEMGCGHVVHGACTPEANIVRCGPCGATYIVSMHTLPAFDEHEDYEMSMCPDKDERPDFVISQVFTHMPPLASGGGGEWNRVVDRNMPAFLRRVRSHLASLLALLRVPGEYPRDTFERLFSGRITTFLRPCQMAFEFRVAVTAKTLDVVHRVEGLSCTFASKKCDQ